MTHRKDDVCQIPIVLLYSELWGFPIKENIMPVRKVQGGYQWGQSGKVYPTREQAERQGRAIEASGYRTKENGQTKKRNK